MRREIPFPESEKSYLTSFAPGDFEEILAKLAEGVAVAGELAPPSTFITSIPIPPFQFGE